MTEREKYPAPFPCFKCGKPLTNLCHPEQTPNQPLDACTFNSGGHYGSTVFDEFDGAKIEINVCDECLKAGQARGEVGYWRGYERRKLQTWKGE